MTFVSVSFFSENVAIILERYSSWSLRFSGPIFESFWGSDASLESALFEKTLFHLNQECQKQLRSSRSLLDYPSTFPSNNATLFIETKSPFPRAISFNSFILSKYVLYFSYFWSILITYFTHIFSTH